MSQEMQILSYLQNGNRISPLEALQRFGCFRLSARILQLRNQGYPITTHRVSNGKKSWAEYELAEGHKKTESRTI